MADIDNLYSDDFFFYYGDNDLSEEIQHDILEQCFQPDRSYYYNRKEAIGVSSYENHPSILSMLIMLPYKIADGLSYKNNQIEDGSYSNKDRRIAVSQGTISIRKLDIGSIGVNILYIPLGDIETPKSMSFLT